MLPARLPVLLACMVTPHFFEPGEVVYFCYEQSWSIFLILRGVYAHVGLLQKEGAIAELPLAMASMFATDAKKDRKPSSTYIENCTPRWPASGSSLRKISSKQEGIDLYPYQLCGPGSYAGDVEVFLSVLRRSVLRCERRGVALVLHRTHLQRLMAEFSTATVPWRREVHRRDALRKRLLSKLTRAQSYKDLAVATIQEFVRAQTTMSTKDSGKSLKVFSASTRSMAWRHQDREAVDRITDVVSSNLMFDGAASASSACGFKDELSGCSGPLGKPWARTPSFVDGDRLSGEFDISHTLTRKELEEWRAEMQRDAKATRDQMTRLQLTLDSLGVDMAKVAAGSTRVSNARATTADRVCHDL